MPGTDKAARRRRYARYTVFGLMSLFLFIGSAFVIGETFTDPGGWTAVLLVCAWLVPAAALSVYAVLRPAQAERLLLVAVAVVAGFVLVESFTHVIPQNDVGPVATVSAFAMSIPLAFLGLRARPDGRAAPHRNRSRPRGRSTGRDTCRVGHGRGGTPGHVRAAVLAGR